MSSAISEDASASLYHCAVKAQGLSGRALRKLPFLAHAKFLRSKGVWHIGECVYARLRAESCVWERQAVSKCLCRVSSTNLVTLYMYLCVCMCICVCAHMYLYIYIYICNIYICIYIYIYIYIYINIYIYEYIDIYIYIYIVCERDKQWVSVCVEFLPLIL